MRLDVYLTQHHYPTRTRAKHAIKNGAITINGHTITKPAYQIKPTDTITIKQNTSHPQGYYKLQHIQQQTQLLQPHHTVIDIGASAGGFTLYAAQHTHSVHAIEYSNQFIPQLQTLTKTHQNITLHHDNAYTINLTKLPTADIILNDLTAEPQQSIKATLHLLPKLKPQGKILQVIKQPHNQNTENTTQYIKQTLQQHHLTTTHTIPSNKKETYIIAEKN
jgi:23S rRNA (cytidine1920-2'-O)/16S rRNA (cytidine1409-2'-O)-methyltransferase